MSEISQTLQQQVQAALADKTPLKIVGGNSKAFYGRATQGNRLDVSGHRGIVSYEPTELVLTAHAGTPLVEIEAALAQHNQMLPFEPPHFGDGASLGGTIACGFSGPRRAYCGAARDFMLGCKIINGKGEIMRFGGEVMKNVAGYDVSRLMVGALGTLGVLLEISLKVLPRPECETTLVQACSERQALERMNAWAGKPVPLSATCYVDGQLYTRLSGAERAVAVSADDIGGEVIDRDSTFWTGVREQTAEFFKGTARLWRISVPSATPALSLSGKQLIEWGGAQRWWQCDEQVDVIRSAANQQGGHATLFRGASAGDEVFQPLADGLQRLHQHMKRAFDPDGIFNPERMYPGL